VNLFVSGFFKCNRITVIEMPQINDCVLLTISRELQLFTFLRHNKSPTFGIRDQLARCRWWQAIDPLVWPLAFVNTARNKRPLFRWPRKKAGAAERAINPFWRSQGLGQLRTKQNNNKEGRHVVGLDGEETHAEQICEM
jgi:hypothetical protein